MGHTGEPIGSNYRVRRAYQIFVVCAFWLSVPKEAMSGWEIGRFRSS